ncbi:TetR/AcrR family transcriptional regulator [Ferroacidibacillus organovorans]|uniref:HTH tetR-type domain-containing protein n=1 Tax=Ferroacidibacillus organovorans TaxID=1765683 RepID=A0A853K799_9BACL|nr:TetR/AcrR family transcriptional regulator [Ferroacidibacillus organovorans]KYP81143.1 hypothetical protein AYJ22_08665 [Ferroacidibacillus organovorans]OAG87895.1 hypothetical protein AYW79_14635 [Ferroacidibacillus organovorans]OAG93109.1 hypothetical protein AYW79_12415 [Ferroacidibacillus organovorans]
MELDEPATNGKTEGSEKKERGRQETRNKILQAAMDVFSEKGYNDTLVDDITRESSTSKGAFYFHFPSKKAIFEVLLDTLIDRLLAGANQAIDTRHGAVEKIRAALTVVLSTLTRHEKATRLLFVEASGLGKTFDRQVYAAHRAIARFIALHLTHAVEDGSIEPIDCTLTAYAWLGAIHEVLLMRLLENEDRPLSDLVDPLCDLLVKSLQPTSISAPKERYDFSDEP